MRVGNVASLLLEGGHVMAWRLRRTVRIAPGIRLNINKRGPSVRVGPKGVGVTVGSHGSRVGAGIPGTGVYAYKQLGHSKGSSSSAAPVAQISGAAAPSEPGTTWPKGWAIAGAIATFIAIVSFSAHSSGAGAIFILLAVGCAAAMYMRLHSPQYRAAQLVKRAALLPHEQQLQPLGEAVRIAPASVNARSAFAVSLIAVDRPVDAVTTLSEGLNLERGNARLKLDLAWAKMAAKDYAGVVTLLEPLLTALDPELSYDQQVLALVAESQRELGQPCRGLEVVKRAPLRRHTLDPVLMFCLLTRATCAFDAGKKAEARRDLDRLYAIDPEFPGLQEANARFGRVGV